jgi:hypothetical protein
MPLWMYMQPAVQEARGGWAPTAQLGAEIIKTPRQKDAPEEMTKSKKINSSRLHQIKMSSKAKQYARAVAQLKRVIFAER